MSLIGERRKSPFTERLSMFMVVTAALGAFLVLFDPKIMLSINGQVITIGGEGFSADLKGAVISAILIGGWTAVKEFWLGSSFGNVKSAESVQRIAEGVPPAGTTSTSTTDTRTTAHATPPKDDSVDAGAQTGNLKTDTVNVEADTAIVNQPKKDKP